MVSQSDWFGSWPLLVPKKVKMDPKMGPTSVNFGPQNANNSTCSQSSSKRKLYNSSTDMLLYLTPNKVHVRCFGVLTSIKSGLRFYANLETDQKASWRPQEAEKVPTETFLDDLGPQVEIKRGPRSTQNRSKTQKSERHHWVNRVSKRKIYYNSPDV
jgi:hypothetical protein